jgi:hypothetical protein
MSRKSKDGSSDGSDGRKQNQTPEHGKIKQGEVRNKWGRAGKPKPQPASTMDALFWKETERIVSHDENGPVDIRRRLILEEIHAALRDSNVRARLLAQLHESGARIEGEWREFRNFVLDCKMRYYDEFGEAKLTKRPPPNVMHPDHVVLNPGGVEFTGPIDRDSRKQWEELKAAIRIAACIHDILRTEHRRTGCPDVLKELKAHESHRRQLMRAVPKGWNWREEIYCRHSQLEFAKQTITQLREMGYASFATRD